MELIDSPSLHDYKDASDRCTCSDAAFTILSDIAGALKFMHASGYVHNDIKPKNIVYHPNRGAIMIDFGVSGPADAPNDGGTPWYLPLEYLADRERGPASDIFALGVTMLWVMRKFSLPERRTEWQIYDIHHGRSAELRDSARRAMGTWQEVVQKSGADLSQSEGSLDSIVHGMLRVENRFTAEDVVEKLQSVVEKLQSVVL